MARVTKKVKTEKSAPPPGRTAKVVSEPPDDMRLRIARKAYELWERRGRQDSDGIRDWLDAEAAIMKELEDSS